MRQRFSKERLMLTEVIEARLLSLPLIQAQCR